MERVWTWIVLGSLWPLVLLLTSLLLRLHLGPLRRAGKPLTGKGPESSPEASRKTLRRILNLPIGAALLNLSVWALVAGGVVAYFHFYRDITLFHGLFLFFRSFIGGKEKIRESFGRYVTPEIRDRILAGLIPSDGERTTATVLFSDLRDFTPYVEENSPEEVVKSMRSYFTAMQQVISSHQGLVLQYVGDGIEASFGAPVPCEAHAEEAVVAALEMRKGLEELNRIRRQRGQQFFRHGIGIHTGPVLAGNTGSRNHLSYALIGETVNVAARIQDLTKQFQYDILISEETASLLKNPFDLRRESPVMVKGYSRPVTVFRVLG